MLQYKTLNESLDGSRFLIQDKQDSLFLLQFKTKEIEEYDFNNDFLQKNIFEMLIVKTSLNKNNCVCELSVTIKKIFDIILFSKDEVIIYIQIEQNKLKQQLIDRFIESDTNNNIAFVKVRIQNDINYFFYNIHKCDHALVVNSILGYLHEQLNLGFKVQFMETGI